MAMESGSAADARHLTFSTLDELWDNGAPMILPVMGDPPCRLHLDPKNDLLILETAYQSPEPDVAKLKNVDFRASAAGDDDVAELLVRVDGNVHAAYGLLATIADQVQEERLHLAAAVSIGVARYKNVFAGRSTMTNEAEVGLFGELLFLEFLMREIGASAAIASWQGPLSEEHDFTFTDVHIEVKTTTAERRKHVIGGLGQLTPCVGVPLNLLSIQITRGDSDRGQTLPELVWRLRDESGAARGALDDKLLDSPWVDEDADLYSTPWILRSQPRSYRVMGDFPSITEGILTSIVPNFPLVSALSYTLDLTGYQFEALPAPFDGFAEKPMKGEPS